MSENLRSMLSGDTLDVQAVAQYLDAMDSSSRLAQVAFLGRAHQARLFEAAAGHMTIGVDYLVPPGGMPMHEVVHNGKNSLPLFTRFAKVFCVADSSSNEAWGYNRNSAFLETVVGPGYFVAYAQGTEVLIDYTRLPPQKPENWPPILPNHARISRFVYNETQDLLRGVSQHVSIGRASKGGKAMDAWFVLCREG